MPDPAAPPYPRAGQEGTPPEPVGVPVRALLSAALVGVAGLLVVALACGFGTSYRIPSVGTWGGALGLVTGGCAVVALLPRAAAWFRWVLVAIVLLMTLVAQVLSTAQSSEVIAASSGPDGRLRAVVDRSQYLGLLDDPMGAAVRLERPGFVTQDLGTACELASSSGLDRAQVRWLDDHQVEVELPWSGTDLRLRFDVVDDGISPANGPARRYC